MKPITRVVVVGIGGIGCQLLPTLTMFLAYQVGNELPIVLVDGDNFEPKNKDRQVFQSYGNKAFVKANELAPEYEQLLIDAIGEYVTPENINEIIQEGDLVFVGVDNHKVRKWISDHCETLQNVTMISGGNKFIDGNAYIYVRENGQDITEPITAIHSEIANPTDKSPSEKSCEELALTSDPQLSITNMNAAVAMLNLFYAWHTDSRRSGEVFFDIIEGGHNPVER